MKKSAKFTYGGANQDVQSHLDLLDDLAATLVSAKVPITIAKALIEDGKLQIPSEVSVKLQTSHTNPPLSMDLFEKLELPTKIDAVPQYSTWGAQTQASKQIELLKEQSAAIEKFKMNKHNAQVEYDEWVKKVQLVNDMQIVLSDKVLQMCDEEITNIITNDIRYKSTDTTICLRSNVGLLIKEVLKLAEATSTSTETRTSQIYTSFYSNTLTTTTPWNRPSNPSTRNSTDIRSWLWRTKST